MLSNGFVSDVQQVALVVRDLDATLELVDRPPGHKPLEPDYWYPAPPD